MEIITGEKIQLECDHFTGNSGEVDELARTAGFGR